MLSRSRALQVAMLACVSAACSDPLSEDRLSVELASTEAVSVRFDCAQDCPRALVLFSIDYPQASYNPADTLQLLQYRIDYDLTGSSQKLPYYAEPLSVVIKPGETKELALPAAGDAQRDRLSTTFAGKSTRAKASLQLAGYDWDNEQIFVKTEFDVQFRPGPEVEQVTDDKSSE